MKLRKRRTTIVISDEDVSDTDYKVPVTKKPKRQKKDAPVAVLKQDCKSDNHLTNKASEKLFFGQKCTLLTTAPPCLIHIASYLDNPSFVYFVNATSKFRELYRTKVFKSLPQSAAIQTVRILHAVFDLKRNVFLTGPAGCGKSHLLNRIYQIAMKQEYDHLLPPGPATAAAAAGQLYQSAPGGPMDLDEDPTDEKDEKAVALVTRPRSRVVMTATTGAACQNLCQGRTIHSFSGLRKGTIPLNVLQEKLEDTKYHGPYKNWSSCTLLLTDEVSMLGSRLIEKMDLVARTVRESNGPFGNLQMIWSGDFMQIPPVGDKYAFTNPVWSQLNFVNFKLEYPFRQSHDPAYYSMLQRMRIGRLTKKDIESLELKQQETMLCNFDTMRIKPTYLFSFHKDVKLMNEQEFNKLDTKIEIDNPAEDQIVERITMTIDGQRVTKYLPTTKVTHSEALKLIGSTVEHRAPQRVQLRAGAQYILTYNFNVAKGRVNGSRMVYVGNCQFEFRDKKKNGIEEFQNTFYFPVTGKPGIFLKRRQIAVRLGYACTIHSSQGMSLDCACIDTAKAFRAAMSYVAFSRVRSRDGLYLKNFKASSVRVHPAAQAFEDSL